MTYDLFLWRRKGQSKVSRCAVYLHLIENLPCARDLSLGTGADGAPLELVLARPDTESRFTIDFNEQQICVAVSDSAIDVGRRLGLDPE